MIQPFEILIHRFGILIFDPGFWEILIQEFRNFDPVTFENLIFDPSDFEISIQILDPPFQGPYIRSPDDIVSISVTEGPLTTSLAQQVASVTRG